MNKPNDGAAFGSIDFDPFAGPALQRAVATTAAQREVWLADRLGREASLAFNEAVTLRLTGRLDAAALFAALDALLRRHEALRATFSADGAQLLIGEPEPLQRRIADLSGESPAARDAALAAARAEAVETPFDLERGPLFRARLFRLQPDEHALLLAAHHAVCDGWSYGVILEDLGALYAEMVGAAPGPEDAIGYGDYVAWETAEAASPAMAEHERYWLGRYAGSALPVLDLPTDRSRPALRTFASRRIDHRIDAALMGEVRKLGGRFGASGFAVLFSAFAAALNRISGQEDIVIGVPAAGQSASGLHRMVGHCVNLLPVRTFVDGAQPFGKYLEATSVELLDAFDHQTLTYGSLLQKLPLRRDPSRLPLVSVMFNVDQAVASESTAYPELSVQLAAVPRHFENFELFVNAAPVDGGLRLECQYNTDLFDGETIARWLGVFESLLRAAVADAGAPISTLGVLSDAERQRLATLQPAPTPYPADDLMHSSFVRHAQLAPDRVALLHAATRVRYDELERRSNQLAHVLRARGVGRGARVGLCLSRGIDMIVAVLGTLKAGAAYVPLDPGFPAARLAYYAEDAALELLLTESTLAVAPRQWRADAAQRVLELDREPALAAAPTTALDPSAHDAQPGDAAYVIYTSGSTGKPKGVCVPHRAVVNFLRSMARAPGIVPEDVLAAVTTLSFDIAVLELLLPLSTGAQVVIVPRETAMDGNLLRQLLGETRATMMQATPAMWRLLLDTDWKGGAGFKALIGGEGLPPDLARELLGRVGELWNMYGPTETTVWSTLWRVDPAHLARNGVSIGTPIANTSVWILDANLQPCPVGVPGEICIGGDGVTLGYLDRPELTADRFRPDPFRGDGGRLYRTGDRGRWRNDGLLEHLGRLDFQVKVRGYRIELGEIEAACAERPDVGQSVVIAREDQPGDVRLVAYLKTRGTGLDEPALREHLRRKLPDYMIPQHVVVLDALPLLPNGKVDRKSLPKPDTASLPAGAERVAPRNELEAQVLAAMERVLNLPGLGVTDDFFSLGGHSLLAARLTARLNQDLELNLPLRTLFESPTAAALAVAVGRARDAGIPKRKPIVHVADRAGAPLTVMQERIRFLEELQPGRVIYNTPSGHRLVGPLNLPLFERALRIMVQRQGSLRTALQREADGSWSQRIEAAVDFPLTCEDLTHLPASQREGEFLRRMQAIVDTPFDLQKAPLFRVALWKLGEQEHGFLFMPHHIIWDGWSFDLLYQEMSGIYGALLRGEQPDLAPLPVSYGDYAVWHNDWLQGPEYAQQLAYWKDRFAKLPEPAAMLTDRPRRRAGMTGEGATEWVHVDRVRTEKLREIARGADATLNMLMMAIYAAMMDAAVGGSGITIGVPVRGRLSTQVEPIMGFFNNLVTVPLAPSRDVRFADWIRGVKSELLEAFSHQDVPFERLAAEPEVAARAQRAGLYHALFSFQDARERDRRWGDLQQKTVLVMQRGATEDLGLWLMEVPGGLEGSFIYNADIFVAETAVAWHRRFDAMLDRLIANPALTVGELLSLDAGERATIEGWSRPSDAAAPIELAGALARRAQEQPGAVALAAGTTTLTWSQLVQRLDADAARLRALCGGAAGGVDIAVCAADPLTRLLGALAALWAGATPWLVEAQAGHAPRSLPATVRCATGDARGRELVGAAMPWVEAGAASSAGSSSMAGVAAPASMSKRLLAWHVAGAEAPVAIDAAWFAPTAGALSARLGLAGERVHVAADRPLPQQIVDAMLSLAAGAQVVLPAADGGDAAAIAAAAGAKLVFASVNTWQRLVASGRDPQGPSIAVVDAAEASDAFVAMLHDAGVKPWIVLRAGERHFPLAAGLASDPLLGVDAGTPLAEARLRIVDDRGEASAIGVEGDVVIVATDEAAGSKSGLRARWTSTGRIQLLGVGDGRATLDGATIDLGSVEAGLRRLPGVGDAAAVLREDVPGQRVLGVYLSSAGAATVDVAAVRRALVSTLAILSTSLHVEAVAAIPRDADGNVRLTALPRPAPQKVAPGTPGASGVVAADEASSAASSDERKLAAIWGELLQMPAEQIRGDDNFFDLGGNSLLAMQAITLAHQRLGRRAAVSLYLLRTLAYIAAAPDDADAVQEPQGAAAPAGGATPAAVPRSGGLMSRLFGGRRSEKRA